MIKAAILLCVSIGAQAQVAIAVNLAARSEPAAWKAWASSPGTSAAVTAVVAVVRANADLSAAQAVIQGAETQAEADVQ